MKWGGAVVCVALMAWIGSVWFTVGWELHGRTGKTITIALAYGAFNAQTWTDLPGDEPSPGIWFSRIDPHMWGWLNWQFSGDSQFIRVPIWLLAMLSVIPTAMAWKRDSLHARRDHCVISD